MSYLDLVEEFPRNPEMTQFEKILLAAKRAKDLHNDDRAPMSVAHHTASYTALQELRSGLILPVYADSEPEETPLLDDDGDEEQ